MFHPHSNFKDAKDWVLIAETGELHPWPWHYDASHFKLLKNGDILHNHPSPKTYSEVMRQGEDANTFFEDEEKKDIQKGDQIMAFYSPSYHDEIVKGLEEVIGEKIYDEE